MSPRLGANRVDYNLAMDPALLQAGKIVAAAEDRSLATLLRHLLRRHIEAHGSDQAKHVYETAADIPHGTRIDRFGKPRNLSPQLPSLLLEQAKTQAHWEERPLAALVRRALERYLEECRTDGEGVNEEAVASEEDDSWEAPDPNLPTF